MRNRALRLMNVYDCDGTFTAHWYTPASDAMGESPASVTSASSRLPFVCIDLQFVRVYASSLNTIIVNVSTLNAPH